MLAMGDAGTQERQGGGAGQKSSAKGARRVRPLHLFLAGVIVLACLAIAWRVATLSGSFFYRRPPLAFQGQSTGLKHTIIAVTLDQRIPAGKNVIWCGSFQLAWNRLRDDVIGGPILISGAQDVADALNSAALVEADLPAGSFYAAAGPVADGIVARITREMADAFGGVDLPDFGAGPEDILAYSYMQAGVKFTLPYFDRSGGDIFTDSSGRETRVSSFGLFQGHSDMNDRLAEQIEVLYAPRDPQDPRRPLTEFALDLSRQSEPAQIVLAVIEPGRTLGETLGSLATKIEQWQLTGRRRFSGALVVPNLHWKFEHRFGELEGPDKRLGNPSFAKYHVAGAWQRIEFLLDKSGAKLTSDSGMRASAIPRIFSFTRPFLIYMKRRDARRPFFVMWVDNAELLCKQGDM